MNIQRNNIFPKDAIRRIRESICSNRLMLSADNQIVFLFGAKSSTESVSARQVFYNYSQKHLTRYQFLLAEDFFDCFKDRTIDLLTIESQLATYTDCVLILLESPGTFAELGAFALNDELAKLILVVNKEEHKNDSSFINLGPLAKVEKVSDFGKVIFTDFSSILRSTDEIEERLNSNLRKNSKTINLSTIDDFLDKKNKRFRLLLISDIISVFNPITNAELVRILKEIYSVNKYVNIDFEVSLLKSLGFINEKNGYLIKTVNKEFFFYKYLTTNIFKTRYIVINHYAKYHSHRIA